MASDSDTQRLINAFVKIYGNITSDVICSETYEYIHVLGKIFKYFKKDFEINLIPYIMSFCFIPCCNYGFEGYGVKLVNFYVICWDCGEVTTYYCSCEKCKYVLCVACDEKSSNGSRYYPYENFCICKTCDRVLCTACYRNKRTIIRRYDSWPKYCVDCKRQYKFEKNQNKKLAKNKI